MKFVAATLLAACLALPAAAQTMQTTPVRPAAPSIAPASRAPAVTSPSPKSTSGLVDINSASASDLDALPGIGKARADAIIKNRPFRGKDDLLDRHIIPPNVYNSIKDKIIARQG